MQLPRMSSLLGSVQCFNEQTDPTFFSFYRMTRGLFHVHLFLERCMDESSGHIPVFHRMFLLAVIQLQEKAKCASSHNRSIGICVVDACLLKAPHSRKPGLEAFDFATPNR